MTDPALLQITGQRRGPSKTHRVQSVPGLYHLVAMTTANRFGLIWRQRYLDNRGELNALQHPIGTTLWATAAQELR